MSLRAAFAKTLSEWQLIAALGICVLAAALRISPLGDSLWLDELHTAWCALGPTDEVAQRAAIGNQGPLYYWLEWLLANVFGPTELSLRFLSLLGGSLLPLALFLFARRWSLTTAGLVAAALVAVDHLSIFYATEARPYALLQVLSVAHLAITAEIAERATLRLRIAWISLGAAMFYLHYTAAIIIAAETAFLFFARLAQIRRSLDQRLSVGKEIGISDAFFDFAVVGVLCLPQLANLRHVFAHRANWAAFIDKQPLWDALDWTPLPSWYWAGLVVLALVAISRATSASAAPMQFSSVQIRILVLWAFVFPICIAWLSTWTDFARIFFARYLAGALPVAALCAGLCVSVLPTRPVRVVVAIATITIAIWSSGVVHQIAHDGRVIADRDENWRSCVLWLNERIADDGYPALVYSGLIEADELTEPHEPLLDEYCLSPVNSLYLLDVDPSDMFPLPYHNPGRLPQSAEQLILHRNGCWLIVRGRKDVAESIATQITRVLNPTPNADQASQFTIGQTQSFGKVHVYRLTNRMF